MADALYLQILDAVIVALNTDRPPGVPVVTSRRTLPGQKLSDPRMAAFLGDEQVDPPRAASNMDPLARRRLPIAIQCAAATDQIDELDRITQPMQVWATQVLGRTRLDGLVHFIRESATQRRPEYLDLFTMTVTIIFECSYQTRRDDLTVR